MKRFYTLPEEARSTIDGYVSKGVWPGKFVASVLANDMKGAFQAAETDDQNVITEIIAYCYNELPSDCWGSYEIVDDWMKKFQSE